MKPEALSLARATALGPSELPEPERIAEVQRRAQEVADAGRVEEKLARLECIIALMRDGLWSRGATAELLAPIWGLAESTCRADAATASKIATIVADPNTAAQTFWAVASEQLDAAFFHLAKIREMVDSVPVETALDVKMVSDALGRCSDSVDKAATTFGRAAGVIQQGSSTTVNVGIMLDAKGQPRPELAALRDGIGRAAAQMDPESARILRDEIASVGESLASARPVVTILADAVTVDDDDVAAVEAHPNEWVNCARSLFPGEDMATIRENVAAMLDALDAEMGEVEQ